MCVLSQELALFACSRLLCYVRYKGFALPVQSCFVHAARAADRGAVTVVWAGAQRPTWRRCRRAVRSATRAATARAAAAAPRPHKGIKPSSRSSLFRGSGLTGFKALIS